jgi:hypothetical protein
MSINHPIPTKAKFAPTANVFQAQFSGVYDFNIAVNQKQTLFKLIPNTIFYLDNFSFAGNIAAEEYLTSLDLDNLPYFTLSKKSDRQSIYDKPIFLPSFVETKDAAAFISSNQLNDEAQITLSAKLNQIATTVGLSPMILTVSFNAFFMDDNEYAKAFMDSLKPEYSKRLRQ